MSSEYPNVFVEIGASTGGLPSLLKIIDHLCVGYQGAIFVAMYLRSTRHRRTDDA